MVDGRARFAPRPTSGASYAHAENLRNAMSLLTERIDKVPLSNREGAYKGEGGGGRGGEGEGEAIPAELSPPPLSPSP